MKQNGPSPNRQVDVEKSRAPNTDDICREIELERQYYQQLFDFAPDGYLVTDAEGVIQEVNRAAAALLNQDQHTLPGKRLLNFVAPETYQTCQDSLYQLQDTDAAQPEHWAWQMQPDDQPAFPAALRVAAQRNANNEIESIYWQMRDITEQQQAKLALQTAKDALKRQVTEANTGLTRANKTLSQEIERRKQAEQALKAAEVKFRAIAQSANDAIIAADGQGNITFWNQGAQTIFGYTEEEMVGQPLSLLMPDRYKDAHQQGLKRSQSGGQKRLIGKTVELQGLRKDTREFPLELSLSSWMAGEDRFFSGIIHDISNRKQAEATLQKQQELVRTLMDHLPEFIYVRDINNGHTVTNVAHLRVLDESPSSGNGSKQTAFGNFSSELAAHYYTHEQEVIKTGRPLLNQEETVRDAHGRKHWLMTTTIPIRDEHGEITALVGVSRDISERKQVQEAYQVLVEHSLQGLVIFQDFRIVFANPALAQITGYSIDELMAFSPNEIKTRLYPADQETAWKRIRDRLAGKNLSPRFETRFIRKDGTVRWVETYTSRLEYQGKPALQMACVDVTDRKQIEQEKTRLLGEVTEQRQELQALASRLAEVQESERQQIARELHDQIGQNLSALGFNLNFVRTQIPYSSRNGATIWSRLNDSLTLVEQTGERIRNVLAELRPPMLDDRGLVDTLDWYARRFGKRTGLTVIMQGKPLTPRLGPTIENTLFRITQEALTNVAKHAQATKVRVSVEESGQTVRLMIADDGIGFEMANATPTPKQQGWGLRIMAERAEMVGACCRVESQPGQGVQVTVEVSR